MLSPDGKWVWDGQQWQPIAHHESVFPSWQSVAVEPAAPAAPAAPFAVQPPVAVQYPVQAPAVVQPLNPALLYAQTQQSAPLWKREAKPGMTSNYLYFVGGLVGIVIILIVLNSVFPLWLLLPGPKPPAAPPAPRPSPLPALTQRSDYARADYFINTVWPSLQEDLQPALTSVSQQCTKQLTNSCQAALTQAEPLIQSTLKGIDKGPSQPQCIAAQVTKLRADIAALGGAMQAADKAFADNRSTELQSAMRTYNQYGGAYAGDIAAIGRAAKTCDPQETGP